MRRTVLFALMISLLLLSACSTGAQDEERLSQFRMDCAQAESIAFTAVLTADLGDTVESYTVDCAAGAAETILTLRSPEMLAGIQATVTAGELALTYEGVVLGAGQITQEGLTPVSAIPAALEAIASGHLLSLWREDLDEVACIAAELSVTDATTLRLYVTEADFVPVYFELYDGEQAVLFAALEGWTLQG